MTRLSLLLAATAISASAALAGTARLQVIHNAADPAAAVVDVYVNGALLLDDFSFRSATPFIDVPAGVPIDIGVAPGSSVSAADTIANFTVEFESRRRYIAAAGGVLGAGFAPNPDGREIGFTIFSRDDARERARWRWFVDVAALHGATDAPTVGVRLRNGRTRWLAREAGYGDFSRYRTFHASTYTVDVTVGGGATTVASFVADLSGLRGGAALVFASGFLDPAANGGGPAFGLFAALPNGTVLPLAPVAETARLQVIHNAADPGAALVDVYVNGAKLLDDFAFRTATPFVDVPAGVALDIGVAGPSSASAADTIANFSVVLEAGRRYIAFANGVLAPGDFAPNPDLKDIGFTIVAADGAREKGKYRWFTDVAVFHGSTDAPTIDVGLRGLPWLTLYNDVSYGELTRYRSLPAWVFVLQLTPGDGTTVVARFLADLRGLRGAAAVVFASGFFVPADNMNGPGFGLFAVLPDGSVVELPAVSAAEAASVAGLSAEAEEFFGLEGTVPRELALGQNYPNPFNPTTTIEFDLPEAGYAALRVYNMIGQEVATLVDGYREAGSHSVTLDASSLPSGTYIYRLQTTDGVLAKKFTLMK